MKFNFCKVFEENDVPLFSMIDLSALIGRNYREEMWYYISIPLRSCFVIILYKIYIDDSIIVY